MYPLETYPITACYESEYDVLIKVGKNTSRNKILPSRYILRILQRSIIKYLGQAERQGVSIYKTIDLVNLGPQLTLDLLIAVDELIFEDILESVQTYLVSVKPNWINEHLIDILNTVTPRRKLFDYCVTPIIFSILPSRLPQVRMNSSILKPEQAILLASWIDEESSIEGPVAYSFRKLYHASKDGISDKEFHRHCDKASLKIVILKISGDSDDGKDQVIGGYNLVVNGWRRG
ncbi:9291_t:CDS:2 [Ambispora leptoticha]|uniref:9291_t:CDS:1 n=1 Tax=Ambispora leptoticha TaxID=144679 RepID=A0A9N9B677_9GLOM|nr:9291_t:CDS:2 [Ambispora leptoticha]